jgi:hypothetical protein
VELALLCGVLQLCADSSAAAFALLVLLWLLAWFPGTYDSKQMYTGVKQDCTGKLMIFVYFVQLLQRQWRTLTGCCRHCGVLDVGHN